MPGRYNEAPFGKAITDMTEQRLVLRRPDDWHVHLRDGALLEAVVNHTALKPPVRLVGTSPRERPAAWMAGQWWMLVKW